MLWIQRLNKKIVLLRDSKSVFLALLDYYVQVTDNDFISNNSS